MIKKIHNQWKIDFSVWFGWDLNFCVTVLFRFDKTYQPQFDYWTAKPVAFLTSILFKICFLTCLTEQV